MSTERKPYTIDSYKAGKKPICRNGQVPSEWHYFETVKTTYRFVAVIDGNPNHFTEKGSHYELPNDTPYDLFEQEDVVVRYGNASENRPPEYWYTNLENCIRCRAISSTHALELTHDPNKPENEQYSVKVVHTY